MGKAIAFSFIFVKVLAGILFFLFLFFLVKWVYLILRERWKTYYICLFKLSITCMCGCVIMVETNAVWPRVVSSFHAMQCFGRLLILGWKRYLCSTVDIAPVWTMGLWILQVLLMNRASKERYRSYQMAMRNGGTDKRMSMKVLPPPFFMNFSRGANDVTRSSKRQSYL